MLKYLPKMTYNECYNLYEAETTLGLVEFCLRVSESIMDAGTRSDFLYDLVIAMSEQDYSIMASWLDAIEAAWQR